MSSKCGTCLNLNLKEKSKYSDKYWCQERKNYFEPTDYSCSYYIEDPNRVRTPGSCYITTIVCNILGYDDNCELLTILRNFRELYLKQNEKFLHLLVEYDIIGPNISYEIAKENNYSFCLIILQGYLIPCVNFIKNNQFEEAINIYKMMVKHLINKFNINQVEYEVNLSDIDINSLGKGRKKLLNT